MERLQKIIANMGYTSRRNAENLIKSGKVKVNGEIIKELGKKFDSKDVIEIDGTVLNKDKKVYYLLNKPRGIICSAKDEKERKTVVDLIDTDVRIYPIGRLDYNTTGAIILTNDGDLANKLMHPSNNIEKVYIAKIDGILSMTALHNLKSGVFIDGNKTKPCKIKIKKIDKKNNNSIIQIIIHEGKNHQIKKMFETVGYQVSKLKREKIAFLNLDGIKPGSYREISHNEIRKLYNLTKKNNV